jgi:hypothetical protein
VDLGQHGQQTPALGLSEVRGDLVLKRLPPGLALSAPGAQAAEAAGFDSFAVPELPTSGCGGRRRIQRPATVACPMTGTYDPG